MTLGRVVTAQGGGLPVHVRMLGTGLFLASGALLFAAAIERGTLDLSAQVRPASGIEVPLPAPASCPGPPVREVAPGTIDLANPPAAISLALPDAPDPPFGFTQHDLKTGMRYSYGFAVADYDCDGRPDVSMFDSYTLTRRLLDPRVGAVGLMQWNGEPAPVEITDADGYPEIPGRPNNIVLFERHLALDVNGDSRPDIVGVVNSHAAAAAYLNPGGRGVKWPRVYLSTAVPAPIAIASGDLDGDGLADLVVAMRDQPTSDPDPAIRGLVWLRNPGSVGPWEQFEVGDSDWLRDPRTLGVADIDGDGRLDIVASDNVGGRLAWWRNPGAGGTWASRTIPGVLPIHGHFGEVRDFDGDGRPDILQPVYQGVVIARNVDGGASWQIIPVASFAMEPRQIVIADARTADMDGDGLADILVSVAVNSAGFNARSRGGLYMIRQAQGGWSASKIYEEDSSTIASGVLDFDGDGTTDLLVNSEYQRNGVSLFINDR